MCVIVFVAGIAIGWGFVLVQLSCMTAFASDGSMGAEQRVLGVPFVVEENGLPSFFVVTLLALLPEIVPMDVIFLVTAIAIRCSLVFVEIALMATLAFCSSVVSLERILSVPFVIEQ